MKKGKAVAFKLNGKIEENNTGLEKQKQTTQTDRHARLTQLKSTNENKNKHEKLLHIQQRSKGAKQGRKHSEEEEKKAKMQGVKKNWKLEVKLENTGL